MIDEKMIHNLNKLIILAQTQDTSRRERVSVENMINLSRRLDKPLFVRLVLLDIAIADHYS